MTAITPPNEEQAETWATIRCGICGAFHRLGFWNRGLVVAWTPDDEDVVFCERTGRYVETGGGDA